METTPQRPDIDATRLVTEVLTLLASATGLDRDCIDKMLELIQTFTGAEAAGLRLEEAGDFPFFVARGLSIDFIARESPLCVRDSQDAIEADDEGRPVLECVCGAVLSGKVNACQNTTPRGSLVIDDLRGFATVNPADIARVRGRCVREGFASSAFVPVRAEGRIIGLIMLHHRPPRFFQRQVIELIEDLAAAVGVVFLRQLADEHRLVLETQLRSAQKMESIGLLAAGIAHDFNNNLSPILGYSEMALSELEPGSDLWEYITRIHAAAERARELVGHLLSFSRKQVLQMRPMNLDTLVADTVKMLRPIVGETMRLVVFASDSGNVIRGDSSMLQQVLLNLVLNAKDAMQGKGRLRLGTSTVQLDTGMPEGGLAAGSYAVLEVADTGPGVPKELTERIFEPFFTTKPRGSGTGLGLSTAFGIVKQHGGHLFLAPSEEGAVFRVYLPIWDEKCAEPPPVGTLPEVAAPSTPASILVVEDDPMVLEVAVHTLEREGHRVAHAQCATAALDLVAGREQELDLLLTDVIMPSMNGWELAEFLLGKHPGLKVLFMSGYSDDVLLSAGLPKEQWRVMAKPIGRKLLISTVEELLRGDVG